MLTKYCKYPRVYLSHIYNTRINLFYDILFRLLVYKRSDLNVALWGLGEIFLNVMAITCERSSKLVQCILCVLTR